MNNSLPPLGIQTVPEGQIGVQVNVSYVVRSMQNQLEDYSMLQYKRLLQLVLDGLREIRLFHAASVEVMYAQPNEAGIVPLPPDYLDYTKIGFVVHGQLVTLSVNKRMILNRAESNGVSIREMLHGNGYPLISGLTDGFFFAPHFRGTEYIGGLYGAGGGFNTAYYRIDKAKNQIQFDGVIPRNEVVIEYNSSGISAGTILTAELIDPLREYAHWKRIEYRNDVPMNTRIRREEQYEKAIIKLRAYTQKFTMSEFLDLSRKYHKQSPKH